MAASVIDTAAWTLVLPLRSPLNLAGSRLIATVTAATGGEVVRLDSADNSITWATDPVTGLTAALSVSVPVAARGDWRALGADGRPGLVTLFFDVLRGVGGAVPEENLGRSGFAVYPGTASPAVASPAGGLRPVLTAIPSAAVTLPALQTGPQGPGSGLPPFPAYDPIADAGKTFGVRVVDGALAWVEIPPGGPAPSGPGFYATLYFPPLF